MLIGQFSSSNFTFRNLSNSKTSLEDYFHWINDKYSNPFIEGSKKGYTMEDIVKYVEEKNKSKYALLMGFFDKTSEKHAGNVKLEPIDRRFSSAWFGILIGNTAFRNRGFAKEIIDCFLENTFLELGIKKYYLGVHQKNMPARRVYLKCGFQDYAVQKNGGIHMVKEINPSG